MTWVIAQPTIWHYGILISDICVTLKFQDGTKKEIDCLQKIYPITNHIAAGFSGSVKIGFAMIEGLSRYFAVPDDKGAWIPGAVGKQWQPIAQKIFSTADPLEQKEGCSLVFVGTHPNKNIGAGMPETLAVSMQSPHFEPLFSRRPLHIGSGAGVSEYKEYIDQYINDPTHNFGAMQLGPYGLPTVISFQLTDLLNKTSAPGISQYIQMLIVERGKFTFGDNSRFEYDKDGNEQKIALPETAKSYSEFIALLKKQNITVGSAIART